VLSRIAESLFWVGRYVERAEDTARIVDVHIHHLMEGPMVDESTACKTLLEAMGVVPPDIELNARQTTELVAFDTANPSSIASSMIAARANARGVRESISSEMWECLNVGFNALGSQIALGREMGPHAFFGFVRERAAVMAGLTDSTMSRDDAWRFLVLGRSLERVDMIARLLSTRVAWVGQSADWVLVLRSCSAHEAFLRTYSREVEEELAVEFLMLDRLFPRSIFHALSTAEECLSELDPRSLRVGMQDEARRILGRVRTGLEFRRIDDLLAHLSEQLLSIQLACSRASDALATRYFRQTSAIEWRSERIFAEGGALQ
jgi:uncharacterized alpha-E superfamily protein